MAEPDPTYSKLCTALKEMAQGELTSLTEAAPDADVGLDLGAQDLTQAEITKSLSRDLLNQGHRKLMDTDGASAAQLQAAQMQVALLSGMEKASRLRHRTRLTSMVWGASRSYVQAQDTGYFGYVLPTIPLQQSA